MDIKVTGRLLSEISLDNGIITIETPPHYLNLLHMLYFGCFDYLKAAYGEQSRRILTTSQRQDF